VEGERIVVAEIVRPRGIRGELLVRPCTDVPGRFESLGRLQATLANGTTTEVHVESAWIFRDDWVLKLANVNSIDEAEPFKGADLWVPRTERGSLPVGEYFQSDLVGCSIVEKETGRFLGKVEGWQQYGGPPMIELHIQDREVLIPFVPEICREVNLSEREVVVDLPEGLLDL
jgi:16S rRNA processing protein RimM